MQTSNTKKEKNTVYNFIIITIISIIIAYVALNLLWHLTSKKYLPSSPFVDTTRHEEDLNHIWDKIRKGHTK